MNETDIISAETNSEFKPDVPEDVITAVAGHIREILRTK